MKTFFTIILIVIILNKLSKIFFEPSTQKSSINTFSEPLTTPPIPKTDVILNKSEPDVQKVQQLPISDAITPDTTIPDTITSVDDENDGETTDKNEFADAPEIQIDSFEFHREAIEVVTIPMDYLEDTSDFPTDNIPDSHESEYSEIFNDNREQTRDAIITLLFPNEQFDLSTKDFFSWYDVTLGICIRQNVSGYIGQCENLLADSTLDKEAFEFVLRILFLSLNSIWSNEEAASYFEHSIVKKYIPQNEYMVVRFLSQTAKYIICNGDNKTFEEITDIAISLYNSHPDAMAEFNRIINSSPFFIHSHLNPENILEQASKFFYRADKWNTLFPFLKLENNFLEFYSALSDAMLDMQDLKKYMKMADAVEQGKLWDDDVSFPDNIIYSFCPFGFRGDICKYLSEEYGIVTKIDSQKSKAVISSIPLEKLELIIELIGDNDISEENLSALTKHYYPSKIKTAAARYDETGRPLYRYRGRMVSNSSENKHIDNVLASHWIKVKNAANKLYTEIVNEGKASPKWISEYRVFTLAHDLYPDTVYQYHANWLGAQSLDVFIPSLSIGIEYQGIQHYKAIEYFGGKQGFERVKERDSRKRKLCLENGVTLIEWKYTEDITAEILAAKLRKARK